MDVEGWARVRVGTGVVYADLEHGLPPTRRNRRGVAPRPFMRPALAKVERAWRRTIETILKRAAP